MREKARSVLRRGLDAYDGRADRREDRRWARISAGMGALGDRPTLKRFFYLLVVVELLFWFLVLAFPLYLLDLLAFLYEWSNRLLLLVVGAVFGIGLSISYVLFRFGFPDLEDNSAGDEPVIGAFTQQARIERKFRVWVVSVLAGVLNFLALMGVLILRGYGW